jgi:type IV pilus assembly protein PilW
MYLEHTMTHALPKNPIARNRSAGMTLIELMVALAIGAFMMIGAVTVFMQSRTTFRVTESISRLQENARFVLEALEGDIRMAGYFGLTSRSYEILFRASAAEANGIGVDTCGQNWLIDLNNAVAGTNNGWNWPCLGAPFPPLATSDTLVVRRVAEDALTPAAVAAAPANTMYIMTFRGGPALGEIFQGPAVPASYVPPAPPDVFAEIHRLVVNGYYVSNTSSNPNLPSLRMQLLDAGNVMRNQEVLAGVEDFQVQFGVDTDAPGTDTGTIDRYVNPGHAILANANTAILAVRIWLRIRAETPERGFVDTATYTYADQNVGPFNDAFRRIVVSKTIYLRNSRPVGT